MAEIVRMPKLSDTMTEGVVSKWHKKVGDQVKSGELLAEIETDKATMEFESFQDGVLLHQGVEEGKSAEVDAVLAIFGKKGEKFEDLLAAEENTASADSSSAATEPEKTTSDTTKKEIDTSDIKATIVRMPKLSDTMTEGTIAKWHKKVGDQVKSGELLAEIETDKATMEFESFDEGTLLFQGVEEQKAAEVDTILAIIGEKGADYQRLIEADQLNQSASEPAAAPVEAKKPTEAQAAPVTSSSAPATTHQPTASGMNGARLKASPLAKKLAEERNINLSQVRGSGDGGRIIKRDIESYVPVSGGQAQGLTSERYQEVDISQMRKTIARRLGESKFTSPHFYLTISLDMEQAMKARKAIIESTEQKVSFNDLVIKAAATALAKHPKVNSSWRGDKIRINEHVNIGVAVAVEEGLLVPVVRYANTKSLFQINNEVKTLATKAKDKKLQPADWEGSTFTVSNLGMFGIEEFTAIINPPDACILAVGTINEVPVVRDGNIVPGHVMKVTLSCDHRVVDGATGAAFLQTFKQYMENPITMYV
jgi:pyruvate dehydrogenase E2 component (dihydrolipoamide acetyltransferase)